mmetsp:Transcript_136361/g.436363  ORF Transcript_136361/g.436363 Transcript_136361/m.436363 type:complete len:262 (+) Transcript_136361:366-1151(+)
MDLPLRAIEVLDAFEKSDLVQAVHGYCVGTDREDGDAETKDVSLLVVAVLEHLRSHEALGAEGRCQLFLRGDADAHAEVRQLQRRILGVVELEVVVRLNVPVHKTVVVQILEAVQHLRGVFGGQLGRQTRIPMGHVLLSGPHVLLDTLAEVATRAEVEDKVVGPARLEEGVHLQNVRMFELAGIGDLRLDTVEILVCGDGDRLEGEELPVLLALHLEDPAKAPLADNAPNLVVLLDLLQAQRTNGEEVGLGVVRGGAATST